MQKIGVLFLLMFLSICGFSQETEDDNIIPIQILGQQDLEDLELQDEGTVTGASRTKQKIEDLPLTIFTISKEEIQRKGYVTLVDVMKDLPGVRFSQPGNAIEGETFLMRGQFGNYYCKILINGLPYQPSVVSGMPIGSQLPIQSAKRIEVIQGPASSVYGADAMAGVINIVTDDTDKRISAAANLAAGTQNYNHIHTQIMGKLGRNKNVVRYSLFASQTVRDDWNTIDLNDSLYKPQTYRKQRNNPSYFATPHDTLYKYVDNYEGYSENVGRVRLPHLSKMVGFTAGWRDFNFGYQYGYRRDHRALGLNPAAVAYYDESTYWGESIHRISLGYQKTINSFTVSANASYLNYRMDNQSSAYHIDPFITNHIFNSKPAQRLPSDIKLGFYNNIFGGKKYAYQASDDFYADAIVNYQFNNQIEALGGFSYQLSGQLPLIDYLNRPFNQSAYKPFTSDNEFSNDLGENAISTLLVAPYTQSVLAAFSQVFFNWNKLKVMAGTRFDNYSFDYSVGDSIIQIKTAEIHNWSHRIGAKYVVNNKNSLRASFATSFRFPSGYYRSGLVKFAQDTAADFISLFRFVPINGNLVQEELYASELGYDYSFSKKASVSLVYYSFFNEHTFAKNIYTKRENGADTTLIGYINDPDQDQETYTRLGSLALSLRVTDIIPSWKLSLYASYSFTKGKEKLPGRKQDGSEISIDSIRMQPVHMGTFEVSFQPTNGLYITLQNYFGSEATSGLVLNQFAPPPGADLPPAYVFDKNERIIPSYYVLNAVVRYKFNKYLSAYTKLNNVFNARYGGLDAQGWGDDLFYNPQPRFNALIGVTYQLN